MFINCLYKIDNYRYTVYKAQRSLRRIGARSLDKPAPITARKFSQTRGRKYESRTEWGAHRPSGIFDRLIAAARIVSGRQVGRNRNDTIPGKIVKEFKATAATTRGVFTRSRHSSRCGGVCLRASAALAVAVSALQMLQVAVISNTCFDRINKSSRVRRVNNKNNNQSSSSLFQLTAI